MSAEKSKSAGIKVEILSNQMNFVTMLLKVEHTLWCAYFHTYLTIDKNEPKNILKYRPFYSNQYMFQVGADGEGFELGHSDSKSPYYCSSQVGLSL